MSRVALLMGVSRYATGLDPLPDAQKDVEALKRVLKQSRFQFESVQCLCDQSLQAMQEAIELFFSQRTSDDQIVFLFCGYTLWAADGLLHFATPSTQIDEAGAIVKAQTIPASVVQKAMNASPAKQQVLILDFYCQPIPKQTAAAPSSDLSAQLGGAGRSLLVASNGNCPYPTPTAIDAWTYTRYLADGIESGGADTDDDGMVSAAALHHYASQKLHVAAPALAPQLYGSTETAQMPLLEVPCDDPQVQYRKVLEAAPIADTLDAVGLPMLEGQSLLNDVRQSLGLSLQEAAVLEAQVLRPAREYRQRLELYQQQVTEHTRSPTDTSSPAYEALKQLQQALRLTDQDVVMRAIVPSLVEQQRQQADYQQKLAQYQQVLLGAMQRRSSLHEGDRAILQRWQQTVKLKDDDVQLAEAQITTQAAQFLAATALPAVVAVEPLPTANSITIVQPPEIPASNSSPLPPPLEAPKRGISDDSRSKEVILQQLFSRTKPERSPQPEPQPSGEAAPALAPLSLSEVPPVSEASPPVPSTAQSNMDRIRRSASNYQALIIPAILLAAIVGLVVAVLPSANRPNWLKFGQTTADPVAAQRFKADGLRKAQAGYTKEAIEDYNQAIEKNPNDATVYMDRGVARHKLGEAGAAIKDYEQALELDPNSSVLHSNLSYAYYDRQNYDKAMEAGNQAVALDGNSAQAYINLANARAKKGDSDGALQDYAQAIALRSSPELRAGAYNNRGNVQFGLNKVREAIADYNQAIQLQSDYADAYYNLGLAQQALGNRTAAIRSLQRAASFYQQQNKEALQKEATNRANNL
ncbi:MAG: tetratricopeptide repeat protein [Stenomitos frigidus ULC029]